MDEDASSGLVWLRRADVQTVEAIADEKGARVREVAVSGALPMVLVPLVIEGTADAVTAVENAVRNLLISHHKVSRSVATYKYLRLIVVFPVVWLLVAITTLAVFRHAVNDSISDYYGGPLRDIFVGTLMACGVCLIAYKGQSKLEDYALNFAGANAFFVALVPNSFTAELKATRRMEKARVPHKITSDQLLQNLHIAVVTFIVMIVLLVLADLFLMRWTRFAWRDQTLLTNGLIVLSWGAEAVLAVMVLAMARSHESIHGHSIFTVVHFSAAGLLVANLSFAAASHAFPGLRKEGVDAPPADPGTQFFFRVVTGLMWVGIVVGGLAIFEDVNYSVISTEIGEILLFLVFWVGATRSEWRRPPFWRIPRPSHVIHVG